MQVYQDKYIIYRDYLLCKEIINEVRSIAETYAQIMALEKALQLIVPQLSDEVLKNWGSFIVERVVKRQRDCSSDTLVVQQFWNFYESYNENVINSNSMVEFARSNLNHFTLKRRLPLISTTLKTLLISADSK
ncbi:hypothetical protein HUE58_01685 [Candidatus Ruthia endofausta]|uniref:Uncharacterized protein n=1 Tax=Candidatus Ruthia endofausta TaxID=2738852 RepID=A0A6N0HNH5_9GAMM|nr:hypothetical protein [Candidatus Ruthia endofausta]QKQ23912.1 hypothetical protein HUE58_01685 [Candidatus Ruthia endofausta]